MATAAQRMREDRSNSLLERRFRVAQAHALAERDARHHAWMAGLRAARRDELAQELAAIDASLKVLHDEEGEG